MDQQRTVQATLRGHVREQVAIGSNGFHLGKQTGELPRIALWPDQSAYGGQEL